MHRRNQWTLRGAALTLFTLMQCASIAAHAQVALPGGPCLTEAHESWSEIEKWASRKGNPAPATIKPKTRPRAGFFVPADRSFNVRFAPDSGHWDGRVLKGR